MCHQSVGLVQNVIEGQGISTVSLTVRPEVTDNVGVPRALFVRFPLGNPVGEPQRPDLQMKILREALSALEKMESPGTLWELPYRWRRMG